MATKDKEFKITAGQLIFPVSLTAFVVFIMLAFQTSQLLRERDLLLTARSQQDKPLEEAQKVQVQLDALAVGTKKLATDGNKNAQLIVDKLKQLGVTIGAPKSEAPSLEATAPKTMPEPKAIDAKTPEAEPKE